MATITIIMVIPTIIRIRTADPVTKMGDYQYLREPAAIYRESFARIRAQADLGRFPESLQVLAIRLVHAVGDVSILADLHWSGDAVAAGRQALRSGAPVLTDAAMVAHGITRARLGAGNAVICRLGEDPVPAMAQTLETTRSAAAVDLWIPDLAGSVVAIGNAPTALFRLLELIEAGGPRPAVILGFPVGFVGAAESKQALIDSGAGVPYVTLRGQRGGSALAAAAVNALAGPGDEGLAEAET